MTTFASLVADTNVITKRPDLVNEVKLAIRQATIQAHSSDFYHKDLFETGIAFNTSDYLQSLDYKALLPRWRSLKYLRKYDAVGDVAGIELTPISIEKALDSYKTERLDVVYLAGAVYQIKSSTAEQHYLLGCYLHPDTDENTYSSWIADECPLLIAYKAASIALNMVGQRDLSKICEEQAAILMQEVRIANIGSIIGE